MKPGQYNPDAYEIKTKKPSFEPIKIWEEEIKKYPEVNALGPFSHTNTGKKSPGLNSGYEKKIENFELKNFSLARYVDIYRASFKEGNEEKYSLYIHVKE